MKGQTKEKKKANFVLNAQETWFMTGNLTVIAPPDLF